MCVSMEKNNGLAEYAASWIGLSSSSRSSWQWKWKRNMFPMDKAIDRYIQLFFSRFAFIREISHIFSCILIEHSQWKWLIWSGTLFPPWIGRLARALYLWMQTICCTLVGLLFNCPMESQPLAFLFIHENCTNAYVNEVCVCAQFAKIH